MTHRHLVFDINVLLDLLLHRGDTHAIETLIEKLGEGEATGWLAAQSLATLEYLLRRQLKQDGAPPEEAKRIARSLLGWLCERLNLLSLPGDESRELIHTATDLEDAQLVLAASALEGDVCIVTRDTRLVAWEGVSVHAPEKLLQLNEDIITVAKVPVLDLAPEQRQILPKLERNLRQTLKSGQFIMGPEVKAFEEEVADYLGVKHAIGVNSGTDALIIGLRALGIGPGDEVITTPFSFFATAESISNVGAKPVFVDVQEESFNLDPALIEKKITARTKAIMPVHLFGRPCEMDAIMAIAKKHRLKVVEDCAQSFGARYQGQQTGAMGEVGAFSFFPSKNLGAYGDGGLIVTNDERLAELARMLRTHGSKKKYHNELLGYNSRLDSLQAAILRVKLPRLDAWNTQRREVAKRYNELLADPGLITPEIADGHVFHQYTIRLTGASRDEVQAKLQAQGISTMVYYPIPQDRLPVYNGQYPANPVSDRLAKQVLSLPSWPTIDATTQAQVAKRLLEALAL